MAVKRRLKTEAILAQKNGALTRSRLFALGPRVCQQAVLEELHAGHPGIVKIKSFARIHVWWCGINKDIEQLVWGCALCQSMRNARWTVGESPR